MASLDYAKDLIELFQQNHSDYVVVVIQPTSQNKKALVFYNSQDAKTTKMLGDTLHYIASEVMNCSPEGTNNITVDEKASA